MSIFLIFGLKLCVLVLPVSLFAVKKAMSRNNCNKTLFRRLTGRPALVLVCFGLSTCITTYIYISYASVSSNTAKNVVLRSNIATHSSDPLDANEITVVTAFFDIGDFGKGSPTKIRTSKTYFIWAQTFKYLLNPLVVYTDSQIFYDHMLSLRGKNQSRTKLLMFNRTSSWAFRIKDAIKEIYDSKDYPKHFPHTVVPEYTCTTHAKFDVVSRAVTNNYFNTKYIMWLDIGYFRKFVKSKIYFGLELPPNFNDSRIAVNQVHNVSMSHEPSVILKQKLRWIGGGLFLGRLYLILQFAETYKRAVDHFLSQKLMNTEEQVLYAMYSKSGRTDIRPGIEIQIYQNIQNPWFYLGYLMKKDVNSSIV